MSTFRIARHGVDMDTGAAGVDRRGVVVVILLCVALFAGCFAIGRAASPRSRPVGQSSPSLAVAFAGAAVPLRLSSAPAIQLRTAAPRRRAPARASEGRSVVHSAPAPVLAQTAPPVQSPVRESAHVPAPVQSPQPQPPPPPAAAHGGEGGPSQPHTGSGSGPSFDSSG
jgi:hypothetical protein